MDRLNRSKLRKRKGATLAEVAGSIALLLPILMIMMMVIIEISDYFVIKQMVAYVARQAAHEVAYSYGSLGHTSMNSNGTSSGAADASDATYLALLNGIAVPGVINKNSASQFRTYFNIPNSPSMSQSFVTVTVTYRSGPGLPTFPWNPLKVGGATLDLASSTIYSTCSWPIPH
jgi:Flp pilus assembly protein TadG